MPASRNVQGRRCAVGGGPTPNYVGTRPIVPKSPRARAILPTARLANHIETSNVRVQTPRASGARSRLEASGPDPTLHSDGRQRRPAGLTVEEVDDDAQHDRPRYLTENKSSKCRFQARFVAIENGFVAPCRLSLFRERGDRCVGVRVKCSGTSAGELIHLND
jgi:hypothetical protein